MNFCYFKTAVKLYDEGKLDIIHSTALHVADFLFLVHNYLKFPHVLLADSFVSAESCSYFSKILL
jgi:hypothetical protein